MPAIVTSDIPDLLLPGLRTIFFNAFDTTPVQYKDIAMVVDSSKPIEDYGWLGAVPSMREMVDERQPAGAGELKFSIADKVWEASISVSRKALEDDQYGAIRLRIQNLAQAAANHKDQICFELLKNGFTAASKAYDGKSFFDTTHYQDPIAKTGSQSNKGATALSASAVQDAITASRKLKNDKGIPLNINLDTLVVPPELEWTALELANSTINVSKVGTGTAGSGATSATDFVNVLQGRVNVIVSPYLTDANDWFLLQSKGSLKSLILQERRDVQIEFTGLERTSENGFMRDNYIYGIRARYQAGYGLWQFAYGASV